ncbi:hypothetical protein JKF63_00162 [Porcisia hertigi]|uniref:Phosphatidylinositol N-acetylglucosaminyltransferase subunit C n=1 Tax=Porcisia hertigi TaxID=2761500 RepID=A0A836L6K7_9TRYP|nr:hypothetical protein JKF63_00162 [Porcisia hertigi]
MSQQSLTKTSDSSQQSLEAGPIAASTREGSSATVSGNDDRRSSDAKDEDSQEVLPECVSSKPIIAHGVPPWRKVLYERQPFEDNYVDPQQFLEQLSQNKDIKSYKYASVVINTLPITQEISIVVLFCNAFMCVFTNSIGKYSLVCIDVLSVLAALVCYVFYQCHQDDFKATAKRSASPSTRGLPPSRPPSRWLFHAWNFARQVVSLVTMLTVLSPILSTLTVTYSDDTIMTLSILTMSLHVLLSDYSYLNAYTRRFDPNLSVNMAICCVVLMASRISSPLASGALICFGIMCFSLSPIVRHLIKHYSATSHITITFALVVVAIVCLIQIPILAFLYTVTVLMISFGIPWLFVRLHSSVKNQINGPWDEAKPTNSAAAAEWANSGFLA